MTQPDRAPSIHQRLADVLSDGRRHSIRALADAAGCGVGDARVALERMTTTRRLRHEDDERGPMWWWQDLDVVQPPAPGTVARTVYDLVESHLHAVPKSGLGELSASEETTLSKMGREGMLLRRRIGGLWHYATTEAQLAIDPPGSGSTQTPAQQASDSPPPAVGEVAVDTEEAGAAPPPQPSPTERDTGGPADAPTSPQDAVVPADTAQFDVLEAAVVDAERRAREAGYGEAAARAHVERLAADLAEVSAQLRAADEARENLRQRLAEAEGAHAEAERDVEALRRSVSDLRTAYGALRDGLVEALGVTDGEGDAELVEMVRRRVALDGTDSEAYDRGRQEGRADVAAMLRAALGAEASDLTLDGLLHHVRGLADMELLSRGADPGSLDIDRADDLWRLSEALDELRDRTEADELAPACALVAMLWRYAQGRAA